MGGLAVHLERAGLATTQISLVRLHTEKIRPPRALWVSFELGRPFGPPDDAEFQRDVVRAALALLVAPSGPILTDYPLDAPSTGGEQAGWSCPLNLSPPAAQASADSEPGAQELAAEMALLAPWYDRAVAARQRTTFGASGLEPEAITTLLCGMLDNAPPDNPRPEVVLADMVRLAAEDLKVFYIEAASAQPGDASGQQLSHWFWSNTVAASILRRVGERMSRDNDEVMAITGRALMVPRAEAS